MPCAMNGSIFVGFPTGALPAPTVDSLGLPTPITTTEGNYIEWPVSYSGTVTSYNLIASEVRKTNTAGSAAGTISVIDGTTATPTVRFTSSSGTGSFTIAILAGACQNGGTNNIESAESGDGSITAAK